MAVEELTVREDGPDVGLGPKVEEHPADERLRRLLERGIARVGKIAGCLVVRGEDAERERKMLAEFLP